MLNLSLHCSRWLWLYCAVVLLILPLQWIISAALAATIHELFHLIAAKLLRVKIFGITIRPLGVEMNTECMSPIYELLVAAAGPCGSFLLLLFGRWIPMVSIFAFIQGLYNLLPIYPSDGGRMLKCLLELLPLKISVQKLTTRISGIITALTVGAAFIAATVSRMTFPVLLTGTLLLLYRTGRNKSLQRAAGQGTIAVRFRMRYFP